MGGGIALKNIMNSNRHEDDERVDFDQYAEMFEEGCGDGEISAEFGVSEKFVKKLREEYQRDC